MSLKASFSSIKSWRFVSLTVIVGGAIVVTTFQNCGKAGFEATQQENVEMQQLAVQSDVTPFAFEAAIDQLTYMSCASPNSASKAFTFKVGAYEVQKPLNPSAPDVVTSGVRITKSYVDWVKQNIRPNYDPNNPNNTVPTATDAKIYLAQSKRNEAAQIQFSMRKTNDLRQVYSSQSNITYGIEVVPMMGLLTDDRWLGKMMNAAYSSTEPAFVNFFPLAENEFRVLEGSLALNKNEEIANEFRNKFDSEALLTVGFDDSIDQTLLRTPTAGSKTVAYGLGFKLLFQQDLDYYTSAIHPGNAPHPWNPRHILTAVSEVNLETGKPSGRTWSCPISRRYSIVRKEDQPGHCPKDKIARMTDANYKKELEILRRHFPAKDYDVSVDGRCIVPLNFRCYLDEGLPSNAGGTSYGMVPVQYDLTEPCFYNTQDSRQNYPATPPTPYCAEVATICVRN